MLERDEASQHVLYIHLDKTLIGNLIWSEDIKATAIYTPRTQRRTQGGPLSVRILVTSKN